METLTLFTRICLQIQTDAWRLGSLSKKQQRMSVPRSEILVLRSSRKTSEIAFICYRGFNGCTTAKGNTSPRNSRPVCKGKFPRANICYLSIAIMSVTRIEPSTNSLPGNIVCYVFIIKNLNRYYKVPNLPRHTIGKQHFLFYSINNEHQNRSGIDP